DLSAALEFDPPVHAEPAAFAAKGLAERMLAGLTARGLSCVRVRVEVTGADGQERRWRWRSGCAGSWMGGTRPGLEGTAARRTRAPAGSPCCAWSRTSWCPTRDA